MDNQASKILIAQAKKVQENSNSGEFMRLQTINNSHPWYD
jgi:hypothetical protein